MNDDANIKEELERLILEDSESLEKIDSLLSEFNVFEILGAVSAEIRHSYFLSWILNPKENHGLGDKFLRSFLKDLIFRNKSNLESEITVFDIEVFDFDDVEIRREWNKIDLMIISERNNLLVAIENKVESKEHSDQLNRYYNVIEKEFPKLNKIYVYLTPEGLTPEKDSNDVWIIYDYESISQILSKLIKTNKTSLNEKAYEFVKQYNVVLRRYFLPNSQIEEISKTLYKKHKKALDIIFQYKTDFEKVISDLLGDLIGSKDNNLLLDNKAKSYITFTSEKLDSTIPKTSEGWTKTKRILLFYFDNSWPRKVLKLYIGPGDDGERDKLFRIAGQDLKLFTHGQRGKKWTTIYKKELISKKKYEELLEENREEDLKDILKKNFQKFMDEDLPRIDEHFLKHY